MGHGAAEEILGDKDLHILGQHHQVDVISAWQKFELTLFLLSLGFPGHRDVVKANAKLVGNGLQVRMIADN